MLACITDCSSKLQSPRGFPPKEGLAVKEKFLCSERYIWHHYHFGEAAFQTERDKERGRISRQLEVQKPSINKISFAVTRKVEVDLLKRKLASTNYGCQRFLSWTCRQPCGVFAKLTSVINIFCSRFWKQTKFQGIKSWDVTKWNKCSYQRHPTTSRNLVPKFLFTHLNASVIFNLYFTKSTRVRASCISIFS